MESQWYYDTGWDRQGPVSFKRLRKLVRRGEIVEDTLIWQEGTPAWLPAREIPGLLAPFRGQVPTADVRRVQYGGFWVRLMAMLIDKAMIGFFSAIFVCGIGLPVMAIFQVEPEVFTAGTWVFVSWIYMAVMESSSWQATIGKNLFNLQVVDVRGYPVSFLRASNRYFGRFISWSLFGVGFFMCTWTDRRQTLHDLMADCLVIYDPKFTRPRPAADDDEEFEDQDDEFASFSS